MFLEHLTSRRGAFIAMTAVSLVLLQGCKDEAASKTAFKMPPPTVNFVVTEAKDHEVHSELLGRTQAFVTAQIRPQVNGIIQKRLFTEGAMVKAGDPLYQIDPAPYEAALTASKAQLAQAQAKLSQASSELKRTQALYKARAVSQQVYENAQAASKAAQAAVEAANSAVKTAQINLKYTKVISPVSGLAGRSSVTQGALVAAYQGPTLVTIDQIDPMYVELSSPLEQVMAYQKQAKEGLLKPLPEGTPNVTITLPNGAVYKTKGTIDFLGKNVDPSTGAVLRRALFDNKNQMLLPGMFITADVVEGIRPNSIALTKVAVMFDPKGQSYVWVVNKDNVIERRNVTLGGSLGEDWLLFSGLEPGERVVYKGFQHARVGSTVNPIPAETKTQP